MERAKRSGFVWNININPAAQRQGVSRKRTEKTRDGGKRDYKGKKGKDRKVGDSERIKDGGEEGGKRKVERKKSRWEGKERQREETRHTDIFLSLAWSRENHPLLRKAFICISR